MWKSKIASPFAQLTARNIDRASRNAIDLQFKIFKNLIEIGTNTLFGKDHNFRGIKTYTDFTKNVPLRDYEQLKPYVERIKHGEANILWRGKPAYFAKTSGTTSGVKYIPISKESIPNHFGSARNALFNYYAQTGNGTWLDHKVIFLSGSPELDDIHGIPTGRLSGISNHMVPAWLKRDQLPSYKTNCIEDWETKLDAIVQETLSQRMALISGIPPWVQMYYERLLAVSGKKTILDIFPEFSVFVYGGVNYAPYRATLEKLVGSAIDSVEVYPASEGFIAFQTDRDDPALWLNVNSGIFFEFVPANEIFDPHPTRLTLNEVETNVNYALIINNNAGLWGYNIGDTVMFTSTKPYKLVVSGRIKHFISAFGEHVISKEVEAAMTETVKKHSASVVEFHVAPQVVPLDGGAAYHEWFIEFENPPKNLKTFAADLDAAMVKQNIYYEDLISGKILRPLIITPLPKNTFIEYMRTQGKLGGQNKVPRLANDRTLASLLVVR